MQWLRRFIAKNPAKVFREGPEPITMGTKEHDMSWAVSVRRRDESDLCKNRND